MINSIICLMNGKKLMITAPPPSNILTKNKQTKRIPQANYTSDRYIHNISILLFN